MLRVGRILLRFAASVARGALLLADVGVGRSRSPRSWHSARSIASEMTDREGRYGLSLARRARS
jgi:hypothetical protein